jgi:hypothetical protein
VSVKLRVPMCACVPRPRLQEIVCRVEKSWVFTIKFPKPLIRRATSN